MKKSRKYNGEWLYHIMFTLSYPRLDVNVSKMMNHLLKSPFCVHPKTQRVCVPMDPETILDFDPSTVPTLDDLLQELSAKTSEEKLKEWKGTSMEEFRQTFKRTFLKPLLDDEVQRRRSKGASMDF